MTTTRTETPGGGWKIRCDECRASAGGTPNSPRTAADIKHNQACSHFLAAVETPVVVTAAQAEAARQGGVSHSGLSDDEIVEAVNSGKLNADDALNRDY